MTEQAIRVPDLSSRPASLTVERSMKASAQTLYRAWTEQWDRWFAVPGSLLMTGAVNAPFFFETEYAPIEGQPTVRARASRHADELNRSETHKSMPNGSISSEPNDARHSSVRVTTSRHPVFGIVTITGLWVLS